MDLASKYCPVRAPASGEATRSATRRPAFSGERLRCTSRTNGQHHRNAGIVCEFIDWVIGVQAMPGWIRFTVICSALTHLARARLNSTLSSLARA